MYVGYQYYLQEKKVLVPTSHPTTTYLVPFITLSDSLRFLSLFIYFDGIMPKEIYIEKLENIILNYLRQIFEIKQNFDLTPAWVIQQYEVKQFH